MPKIFIARPIPEPALSLLKKQKDFVVDCYEKDEIIPRKELLKRIKGADAVLPILTDRIDKEFFDAAGPQLKIVANYAIGFDNVDLKEAKKRGVIVTNTPVEEAAESVAEHTIGMLIALAHRMIEADAFARAKKYKGWSPNHFMGFDLRGKTLGLIGLGRIGKLVAKHAVLGFGMKVIYADMKRDTAFEKEFGAKFMTKEKLLESADAISLHVPLLPSTKYLIDTAEFSLMKKKAILINTSRGPVVREKALLRALRTKRIGAAGLDVFECEPAIDCDLTDKLELKSFSNVLLTPHTASATIEARAAMSKMAAENIIAVLNGKPPISPAK
ncbi:MAG: D-glycerate dehydrogenase [Patescibacteria group bacterium]